MSIPAEVKNDSGRTSDEKAIDDRHLEAPNPLVADLPPDPDSHLSAEERAKIVSYSSFASFFSNCLGGFANWRLQDRKLLWKLDLTLIPWLCILYLLAFLDRTNIGNAKIDNLPKDLHLTTGSYNAALSIFFVSYSVFEPLTNVALKRLRPSVFIPIIMYAL